MQSSEDPVVKNPFNLPTYQRRLRHLQSIAVRNLSCPGDQEIDLCNLTVYFTLHKKVKQKAFYTSEKITGSLNPTWQSFGLQRCDTSIDLSAKSVVVRIWCGHGDVFKVKIEVEVNFSGLLFFSNKLQVPGIKHQTDTLLFGLFNKFFIHYDKTSGNPQLEQWIPDTDPAKSGTLGVVSVDLAAPRPSYSTSNLKRIHMVQRAVTQTQASVKRIHSDIEDRLLSSNENAEKLSQREVLLMKVRQFRQELLWQTQQKQVELEKFEKYQANQNTRLNTLKEKEAQLQQMAWDTEEKRTLHIQSREMLVKENAQVLFRRKQIIREMVHDIYPITEDEKGQSFYICNVRLPNAEDYQGQDELRVSVALGFTCHLTQMISHFMDLPLRYPMVHRGSRSTIIDHIHSKLTEKDREFPLYGKGKEKFQYNYAVFLLNKNISQLRFYCGLGTNDLRQTLPNLKSLLEQRLGVRSSSMFEQRDSSTIQSPPPTSIAGSQASRMSQAISSNTSSIARRDLVPELDNHALSISRSASATGEGISLTNFGDSTSLKTGSRMGHSMSFPQTTNAQMKNVSSEHEHFDYDPQISSAAPLHSYNLTSETVYEPQNFSGYKEGSPAGSRTKDSHENVIEEVDETEDVFAPTEDSFFQVKTQPEFITFNKMFQDMQNISDAASSSFNNGIIPNSDIFLDTTQRSFKLVKTSAMSSRSGSDLPSDGSQVGTVDSPNGYHSGDADLSHDETQQVNVFISKSPDTSSIGPSSSHDVTEFDQSQEKCNS